MPNELITIFADNDKLHSLLEPSEPAYTDMTLRRACIVWLRCGKINDFKQVAEYFHRLEAMEEEMPMEERVRSRLLEYNIMTSEPPTSEFLNTYFPNLYQQPKTTKVESPVNSKFDAYVFNLEGYNKLHVDKGMTRTKILEASVAIKKYCREHSKSLKLLLTEFVDFAKKCNVEDSVNNLMMFIMKNLLKDEIQMNINIPKNFSFLDIFDVPSTNKTDLNENSAIDPKQDTNAIKRSIKTKKNEDKTNIKEEMLEEMKENIKEEMKGEIKEDMKEIIKEDMKAVVKEDMKEEMEVMNEKINGVIGDMKKEINGMIGDLIEETTEETMDGTAELLESRIRQYNFKNISLKITEDKSNPKCETWIESFIIYSYFG